MAVHRRRVRLANVGWPDDRAGQEAKKRAKIRRNAALAFRRASFPRMPWNSLVAGGWWRFMRGSF